MERVGIRELRNQVAAVVRRAGRGDRIVVTVDGRPVAQLGPLEPDRRGVTLDDLVAAGLIEPPATDLRRQPVPEPLAIEARVDRVLDELRGP